MSSNKTIVFLSHFDGNLYLFRLPVMEALARKGWRAIALCPAGEYSARFGDHGIEHIGYTVDRAGLNPLKELKTLWAIRNLLKNIRPDILHTFTVKPNLYGTIAGRLAGVKTVVITVTGLGSFFIDRTPKARLIRAVILAGYRLISPLASRVLFQNEDDRALFIQKRIVPENKTVLIGSSGIDTTLWQPAQKPAGPITVLFVGRLLVHKGVPELMIAAKNLKARHGENLRLILVGDLDSGNPSSIDAKTLQNWKNENLADFPGWQTDPRPWYELADIFALPSHREGLPRTAIEAMAMGLPVVTTDAPGCRDTIENGVSGLLFPVGDAAALETALETLIADETLRRQMGEAARRRAVAFFDVRAVVDRYLELYDRV